MSRFHVLFLHAGAISDLIAARSLNGANLDLFFSAVHSVAKMTRVQIPHCHSLGRSGGGRQDPWMQALLQAPFKFPIVSSRLLFL